MRGGCILIVLADKNNRSIFYSSKFTFVNVSVTRSIAEETNNTIQTTQLKPIAGRNRDICSDDRI
jgi:hypothetical protein